MKIGIAHSGIKPQRAEQRLRMIADAGFDGVDTGVLANLLTTGNIFDRQISEIAADETAFLAAAAEYMTQPRRFGLELLQAHAPQPSASGDPEYDKKLWEILALCVRACDAADCRTLVIHPAEKTKTCPLTPEQEIETTLALGERLIAPAKQYGVTVCIENMYSLRENHLLRQVVEAPTADPDALCAMIDELNRRAGADVFGFCLDTGHMLLYGRDYSRVIPRIGSRLKALHLHDNDGVRDQHTAPYMGVLQWDQVTNGLAAADYRSALCFETSSVWKQFDPALMQTILNYIAEAGRLFARRIEEGTT